MSAQTVAVASIAAPGEIVIRLEDAAYTNTEQALRMLPRTGLVWDDVRVLLGTAARLIGHRSSEESTTIVLDSLLRATPAQVAAVVLGVEGAARAKTRTGEAAADVSEAARLLSERCAVEKAGILVMGEANVVAAPLVYQDTVVGSLILESSTAKLDKRHLQLTIGIAVLAAPALAAKEPQAAPEAAPAKRPRKTKSK